MQLWPGDRYFQTVTDHGAHAALWPLGRRLPRGWQRTGYYGPRGACLEFLGRSGTYRPGEPPGPAQTAVLFPGAPAALLRAARAVADALRGLPGGPPRRVALVRPDPAALMGALTAGSICVIGSGPAGAVGLDLPPDLTLPPGLAPQPARAEPGSDALALELTTALVLGTDDGQVCFTDEQLAATARALSATGGGGGLAALLRLLFGLAGRPSATMVPARLGGGVVLGAPELPVALIADEVPGDQEPLRVQPAPGVTARVLTADLDVPAEGDWGWLNVGSGGLASGYAAGSVPAVDGLARLVPDPFEADGGRLLATPVPARRDESGALTIAL